MRGNSIHWVNNGGVSLLLLVNLTDSVIENASTAGILTLLVDNMMGSKLNRLEY